MSEKEGIAFMLSKRQRAISLFQRSSKREGEKNQEDK